MLDEVLTGNDRYDFTEYYSAYAGITHARVL